MSIDDQSITGPHSGPDDSVEALQWKSKAFLKPRRVPLAALSRQCFLTRSAYRGWPQSISSRVAVRPGWNCCDNGRRITGPHSGPYDSIFAVVANARSRSGNAIKSLVVQKDRP